MPKFIIVSQETVDPIPPQFDRVIYITRDIDITAYPFPAQRNLHYEAMLLALQFDLKWIENNSNDDTYMIMNPKHGSARVTSSRQLIINVSLEFYFSNDVDVTMFRMKFG